MKKFLSVYGVAFLGVATLCLMVYQSLFPEYYSFSSESEFLAWKWSSARVFWAAFPVLVEVGVFYLIVRPHSFDDSKVRIIVALVVFVPWSNFLIHGIQGAPLYSMTHIFWLFILVLGLLSTLMFCLLRGVYIQFRGKS